MLTILNDIGYALLVICVAIFSFIFFAILLGIMSRLFTLLGFMVEEKEREKAELLDGGDEE